MSSVWNVGENLHHNAGCCVNGGRPLVVVALQAELFRVIGQPKQEIQLSSSGGREEHSVEIMGWLLCW
jgi:hypothetical protein